MLVERRSLRVPEIDFYKGVLIFAMIVGHARDFLLDHTHDALSVRIHEAIAKPLIFSGFFFCFGVASYRAYMRPDCKRARPRALRNALRIYVAYLVLGGLWYLTQGSGQWSFSHALNRYAVGKQTVPFAEFLLAYAGLALLVGLAPRFWGAVVRDTRWTVLAILLCAATTFYPAQGPGALGVVWPARGTSFYPVLPYLTLFLAGALFSRVGVERGRLPYREALRIGAAVTATALAVSALDGYPRRFPPTAAFMALSLFPTLFLLFAAARFHESRSWGRVSGLFREFGTNTLFYFFLSNALLFPAWQRPAARLDSYFLALLAGGGVFFLVHYLYRAFAPR